MNDDEEKSETVTNIISRIMETDTPDVSWMSGPLAHRLLAALEGGKVINFVHMMREGLTQQEAEEATAVGIPLMAFQLGLQVGQELEATRTFREQMGDL